MSTLALYLSQALQQNKLTVDPAAQEKLIHYLTLLQTWNRVFNLTTITEPREMVYLHLIDSLVVAPFLVGKRFLDVGSGAGLPGIPLAIVYPDQQWVVLDKNSKKTRFLTQAVAELKLSNVEVVHKRCEEYHPEQGFDSILSRAFGTIRLFVETTAHLLHEKGVFLAMKGKVPKEELADLPDPFLVQTIAHVDVKGIDIERHVVSLRMKQ